MTWKRELAFWTFMFLVALWFLFAIVSIGRWTSENWGAGVAIERAR